MSSCFSAALSHDSSRCVACEKQKAPPRCLKWQRGLQCRCSSHSSTSPSGRDAAKDPPTPHMSSSGLAQSNSRRENLRRKKKKTSSSATAAGPNRLSLRAGSFWLILFFLFKPGDKQKRWRDSCRFTGAWAPWVTVKPDEKLGLSVLGAGFAEISLIARYGSSCCCASDSCKQYVVDKAILCTL